MLELADPHISDTACPLVVIMFYIFSVLAGWLAGVPCICNSCSAHIDWRWRRWWCCCCCMPCVPNVSKSNNNQISTLNCEEEIKKTMFQRLLELLAVGLHNTAHGCARVYSMLKATKWIILSMLDLLSSSLSCHGFCIIFYAFSMCASVCVCFLCCAD